MFCGKKKNAKPTPSAMPGRESRKTCNVKTLCGMYGVGGARDAAPKGCRASAANSRKCCRDGGNDDGTARVNYIAANLSYEDKSDELSDKK